MNMKYFGAVATSALLLSGAQAFAATVIIDDFNTVQSVTDVPLSGQTNTSTISTPSAIGGSRTLTAKNSTFSVKNANATSLTSGEGFLQFSNDNRSTGRGTLTFSGLTLSAQSDSFFTFSGTDFDNGFDLLFGASAEDSDGTMISFSEDLSTGFSPILSFTQFDEGDDLADFNFDNIAMLSFFVDSTGRSGRVDGELGLITLTTNDVAPIPLPAAGLLLLGGLGGLGGISALRRRRKA